MRIWRASLARARSDCARFLRRPRWARNANGPRGGPHVLGLPRSAQVAAQVAAAVQGRGGRLGREGATFGLDLQTSPKEARHRDLHALQLCLNAAERDALLAYLVRSRPDSVGASQEQLGREVRGNLDLGFLLQPEPLLQDPR